MIVRKLEMLVQDLGMLVVKYWLEQQRAKQPQSEVPASGCSERAGQVPSPDHPDRRE